MSSFYFKNRFQQPVKKERWEREYEADDYGPPCVQFMDFHRFDRYSARNMLRTPDQRGLPAPQHLRALCKF
jgi:hypothetical protein